MSTSAYCFAAPICWQSAIRARNEKSAQLVSRVPAMAWSRSSVLWHLRRPAGLQGTPLGQLHPG